MLFGASGGMSTTHHTATEWRVGIRMMQFFLVLIILMVAGRQCDGLPLPCPTRCTCYGRTVTCGDVGPSDVPSGFPQDTDAIILSRNQLKELPENIFQNLTNLRELYLNNNQLKELPENIFQNLTNLRQLVLTDNQLKELPENIFQYLTNLRQLHLAGNQLNELLGNIFQNLTNLRDLNLEGNQLNELPGQIFQTLTNIEALYLSKNQLNELPENIFQNLTHLRGLGLSFNRLKELPGNIFQNLTNLRYLLVFNNTFQLGNGLCSLAAAQLHIFSIRSDAAVENYTRMMITNCSGSLISCYAIGNQTKYFCRCPSGQVYNGSSCTIATSLHTADIRLPCHKYPQCQPYDLNSPNFHCQCRSGCKLTPQGHMCANFNECDAINPSNGGWTCIDTDGSYNVYCTDTGYYSNGAHCVNANECADVAQSTCHGNTMCVDTVGSFRCECKTGLTGNQTHCTDVDECDVNAARKCPSNSLCRNLHSSFSCDCENGFTANTALTGALEYNQSCDNVNECMSSVQKICKENSTCTDTYGSYKCVCKSGYQADQDSRQAETCVNINECNSAVSASACKEDFTCIDTPGSFVCVPNSDMETAFTLSSPSSIALLAAGTTALLLGGVMTVVVLLMKRKFHKLTVTASSAQTCATMELKQDGGSVMRSAFTDNNAYGMSPVNVNNVPVNPPPLTDPVYSSIAL